MLSRLLVAKRVVHNLTELHCIPLEWNLPGTQNENDINGESTSVRLLNYNTEAVAARR